MECDVLLFFLRGGRGVEQICKKKTQQQRDLTCCKVSLFILAFSLYQKDGQKKWLLVSHFVDCEKISFENIEIKILSN